MTRFRVYLNIGVFLVASTVMVVWAVDNIVSFDQLEDPYTLNVEAAAAFGVVPNAEVTYLGVNYGSVVAVERVPGGVVIETKIRKGHRIPAGSFAHVLRKSVIGEPYIDFSAPEGAGDEGPWYEAGDTVPRDRTTVPLEFSELLRSADALLASVPPEDVATLLREASIALNGRAESLQQLARAGDELSASLASRSEALDRLATNNTRLTRVVAEHRQSLGQSLTDLRAVAESLRRAAGDTSTFLDSGSQVLTQLADIVAAHKGNLDCDLKTLEMLTDRTTTPRRLAELRALLDWAPVAFGYVWEVTDVEDDGRWVRVGFISQREDAPRQHTPPRALPESPPVPPCTSPLQPVRLAGVDTARVTGGAGATAGADLPATGLAIPASVGAVALLLLLAARRFGLRSAA